LTSGRSLARRSTDAGFAQRHDGSRQHDVVGHHDRVLALRERRVEQPERGDVALQLAREPAGLQPHALADPERSCRDQDQSGDQVAERLLSSEADDDRGSRRDGQRALGEAGDSERDERRHHEEGEPDQEADGAGRGGVHAAEQRGGAETPDVTSQRPPEGEHEDRRGDADRLVEAEPPLALGVGGDRQPQQREQHEQLALGAASALGGLERQAPGAGGGAVESALTW